MFLVHGVFGNATHFGSMAEALKARLPRGERRVQVFHVGYDTLDAKKTVVDFADTLDRQIQTEWARPGHPDDRVALIGHSQGGLVIEEWLYGAKHRGDVRYAVDAVVTLGTPYWGSKMANFVRALSPSASLEGDAWEPGGTQLANMAFGSEEIATRRRRLFRMERGERVLAIGGATGWLDAAAPFSVGKDRFEDDTAVTVPSSNPRFYGYIEDAPGPARIGSDAFHRRVDVDYRVVDAIHLSPSTDLPQLSPGIAQVPSGCVDATGRCHPAFDLVLTHLAGFRVPPSALDASMTGFMVSVDVQAVDGGAITPAVTLRPEPGVLEVSRLAEPYADVVALRDDGAAAFTFFGSFSLPPGNAPRTSVVVAEISAPGYGSRSVEIPVRATESTYVRLIMRKTDPDAEATP